MLEFGKAKAGGLIGHFLRDERGTSAIEYAIIASGVSIVIVGTVATLVLPAVMVFVVIPGPGGQPAPVWKAIWPAFGATNQLLGALALLVVYSWLRREGRRAWFILIPMVFMFVTTLTALVQLVGRNLLGDGSRFVGGVSVVLGLLSLAVLVNAARRWRTPSVPAPDTPGAGLNGTAGPRGV